MSKLSDLLLSSGFSNPWGDPSSGDEDRSMQALHDAILEALFSGGVLSEEALQQLLGEPADGDQEAARQQLEDLIQQIIEKMMEQGFVTGAPDLEGERDHRRGTAAAWARTPARCASRSLTRRSTSSATGRCATCSARSDAAAPAGTTRAIWRPASKRSRPRSRTSSATR